MTLTWQQVERVFDGNAAPAVIVHATAPIDAVIQRIAAADAPVIIVLAGPELLPLDRAMLVAAIGPLAIRLGMSRRLNMLDIASDVADVDVLEAASFLAAATSTTGQVLRIKPDQGALRTHSPSAATTKP